MDHSGSGDGCLGIMQPHRKQHMPGIQAVYIANWVIIYISYHSLQEPENPLT